MAKPIGVAMHQVCFPTTEPLDEFGEGDAASAIVALQPFEPQSASSEVIVANSDALWQNPKTDKIGPILGGEQLTFDGMDGQAQGCKIRFNPVAGFCQLAFVIAKQGEVVHVSEVVIATKLFFHKMIEGVEVDVGQKLAGQIADGKSFGSLYRGQQVIAGEIVENGFLRVAAVNDGIDQPQGIGAFNFAKHDGFEDRSINTRKIFTDIALQDIAAGSGIFGELSQGAMGSVPSPIRIAGADKGPLHKGHDDIAQRMMHHAIAIGRCGN